MRLLLTQLYDPSPEITEVAVQLLEEVCESKEFLQMVVELQPAMSHLGEIGDALLMRYICYIYWHDKAGLWLFLIEVHVNVDGLQVSLWSRAYWSRNRHLVSCTLPSGLASPLLSLSPVLQERNLVYVVDIEIFLAKLFNTVLVAEDEEELLWVIHLSSTSSFLTNMQCIRWSYATSFLRWNG